MYVDLRYSDGHGWMLWDTSKSMSHNLRLLRGHLIRVAGFERLGNRGCICGNWWEPLGRRWPGWFWRHWTLRLHQRRECPVYDSKGHVIEEVRQAYLQLWEKGVLP